MEIFLEMTKDNENQNELEAEVTPQKFEEGDRIPLAGVGRRFLALLIDALLLSIISRIIKIIPILSAIPFIMYFVFIIYSAWLESSKYRGTLGKIALGIEVTDAVGRTISVKTAVFLVFEACSPSDSRIAVNSRIGIPSFMIFFSTR